MEISSRNNPPPETLRQRLIRNFTTLAYAAAGTLALSLLPEVPPFHEGPGNELQSPQTVDVPYIPATPLPTDNTRLVG